MVDIIKINKEILLNLKYIISYFDDIIYKEVFIFFLFSFITSKSLFFLSIIDFVISFEFIESSYTDVILLSLFPFITLFSSLVILTISLET